MSVDLFLTDKDRMKEWLMKQRFVKTSDVIRWGCENHSNRANRNKQEFAHEGFLRRLSEEEKYRLFGIVKEDYYEVMKPAYQLIKSDEVPV